MQVTSVEALEGLPDPKLKEVCRRRKCVAVAKDVLSQIPHMVIKRGCFIGIRNDDAVRDLFSKNYGEQVRRKGLIKHCNVCAVGACFLAMATLDDAKAKSDGVGALCNAYVFQKMLEYFTPKDIYLIESAFELGDGYFFHQGATAIGMNARATEAAINEWLKAVEFGESHAIPSDRLEAIMQNIIDNGGEFRP